jgi:hypothetical protein
MIVIEQSFGQHIEQKWRFGVFGRQGQIEILSTVSGSSQRLHSSADGIRSWPSL